MRDAGQCEPHLDAAEGADQREVAEVAEMADAEDAVLELAEPVAEAHVEALEDQPAQPVGAMALRQTNRGQRAGIVARLLALQFDATFGAPDLDRRPRRGAVAGVAGEDVRKTFLVEHR